MKVISKVLSMNAISYLLIGLIFLTLGDIISTFIALSLGAEEMNPVFHLLTPPGAVAVKMAWLAAASLILLASAKSPAKGFKGVSLAAAAVFISIQLFGVVNNCVVIAGH
jgi:hypothetical protein